MGNFSHRTLSALQWAAPRLALPVFSLFLAACGTVDREDPDTANAKGPITPVNVATDAPKIRIDAVSNLTGNPDYDNLRLYVHIKAASLLDESGRFQVVSDETLTDAEKILGPFLEDSPRHLLEIDLLEVDEKAGATVKIGFVSRQEQSADVTVRLRLRDTTGQPVKIVNGRGESKKGSTGVVISVDRESLLKGKGIWQLDNSMLGIAAQKALSEAIAKL